MNYLLDTHTFLWFIMGDPALSPPAQATIEASENTILLSTASLWEMAIKVSLGSIQTAHIGLVATLPFHHRDPFDRLIIAQSLVDQIPIIGKDRIFDAYGVQLLW